MPNIRNLTWVDHKRVMVAIRNNLRALKQLPQFEVYKRQNKKPPAMEVLSALEKLSNVDSQTKASARKLINAIPEYNSLVDARPISNELSQIIKELREGFKPAKTWAEVKSTIIRVQNKYSGRVYGDLWEKLWICAEQAGPGGYDHCFNGGGGEPDDPPIEGDPFGEDIIGAGVGFTHTGTLAGAIVGAAVGSTLAFF